MAIENKDLNIKIGADTGEMVEASDLIWGDIEDGLYEAELAIVYPWKKFTKDTNVRIKGDDGKYLRDENNKYITETKKDVTWHSADLVFKIVGSLYDGYAVKGSISTHPIMLGSAKRFLYLAKLFDVELGDLNKHTGVKIGINVKTKTEKYVDKDGFDVVKTSPYVSYYEELKDELTE